MLYYLNYAKLTWAQNLNAVSRIVILQTKALIMKFQSRDSHSSLIFKSNHILKLEDQILIENILFINKSFNNFLPPIFKSLFIFCSSDVHNYQTVSSTVDKIFKPSYRTDSYGKNSITIGAINSWNKIQHQFSNLSLRTYSPTKIECLLFKK